MKPALKERSYKRLALDMAERDVAAFYALELAQPDAFTRLVKDMIRARYYRRWRLHRDGCADPTDCPTCLQLVSRLADRMSLFMTRSMRGALILYCRDTQQRFDDVRRQHLIVGIFEAIHDELSVTNGIRFGRTLFAGADAGVIRFSTRRGPPLAAVELGTGTADYGEWFRIAATRYARASLRDLLPEGHPRTPTREPSPTERRVRDLRATHPDWSTRRIAEALGTTAGSVRVMAYRLRRKGC